MTFGVREHVHRQQPPRDVWSCLRKKKDEIRLAVSIFSLILVGAGLLVASLQANRATTNLQASNVYQIQKDARALREDVFVEDYKRFLSYDDKTTVYLLREGDHIIENSIVLGDGFKAETWKVINFYAAVYRQGTYDMLPSDFVNDFAKDFCIFFKNEPVRLYWKSLLDNYKEDDKNAIAKRGRQRTKAKGVGKPDIANMPKRWCGIT